MHRCLPKALFLHASHHSGNAQTVRAVCWHLLNWLKPSSVVQYRRLSAASFWRQISRGCVGSVRWQREFPPLAIKLDGCDNTGICYCNRLAEYPVMCRQRRAPFPLLDLGHQHLGHCSCSVLRAGRDGSRVQKCTDSMRGTIIDTAAATAAEPLRAGSRT